jgi:hypothetical protein
LARKKGGSQSGTSRTPRATKQTGSGKTGKIAGGVGATPPTGGGPPPGTHPPAAGGEDDGYQRTADIQEAEAFARSLGISRVRYTDPAVDDRRVLCEIANNTNEALAFIRSRGIIDVPKCIETNRLYFVKANTRGSAWAAYEHDALLQPESAWLYQQAIVINPRPEWVNVDREVSMRHAAGYLSTGDAHHFIYHEYGHFLYRRDNPLRPDPAADRLAFQAARGLILAHVGRRALDGIREFIAEMFAKLVVGAAPLAPQVQKLYRQLGGRMV